MEIVKKNVYDVLTTLSGEVIGMDIDPLAVRHIMDVLSNLYSDPVSAIIREYSCNALDSHIEAGQTRPIEVTLPSPLAAQLRIRDWGVGLDAEGIRNVYSKYGRSTKTSDNRVTGALGLGGKSAFTYTPQFTVEGVRNGKKIIASVSRNSEGVGTITIVDEFDTDEPNGVQIIIPASKWVETFRDKAAKLFKFWPKGTVLVDGEEPEVYEGLDITPELSLVKGDKATLDEYGRIAHYVVMGNCPYPVDPDQFDFEMSNAYGIVARVPLGSVHFTPSRELLDYTEHTLATLGKVKDTIQDELAKTVEQEIENAQTPYEAVGVVLKWRQALPIALQRATFSYHRMKLPDTIEAPDGHVFHMAEGKPQQDWYGKPYRVGAHSRVRAIDLVNIQDAVWVYGFDRNFTPACKKKLWKYFDDTLQRDYPSHFIMCRDKPDSKWINPDDVIPWAPVEAIRLPRISKTGGNNLSGRPAGSYDIYVHDSAAGQDGWERGVVADDIPDYDGLYYVKGDDYEVRQRASSLHALEDSFVIVMLSHNRVAKFLRLFPHARPVLERIQECCNLWFDSLSSRDKRILSFKHTSYHMLRYLEAIPRYGVADPVVRELHTLAELADSSYAQHLKSQLEVFSAARYTLDEISSPFNRYPLLDSGWGAHKNKRHNLVYLNAAYTHFYQETS